MKINAVGWFKHFNAGDFCFKVVHQNFFFPGHDLRFITPPQICEKDADLVILGGGAVVSPFYLDTLPQDKPKYALGVDIAYESEMDLMPPHKFKGIYIRNRTDVDTLQSKVDCPVRYTPDLAYALKPSGKKWFSDNKPKLGVFCTDYINPAIDRPVDQFSERAYDFKIKMARRLDRFIQDGWDVYLVPCATAGYGNDIRVNLDLQAFMKRSPKQIMTTLLPQDMIDLIASFNLTICTRFHAHLFSIIAGTPFVSIQMTRKVKLALEENRLTGLLGGIVDEKRFDDTQMEKAIETAMESHWRDTFLDIAQQNYKELEEVKKQVWQEWLVKPV